VSFGMLHFDVVFLHDCGTTLNTSALEVNGIANTNVTYWCSGRRHHTLSGAGLAALVIRTDTDVVERAGNEVSDKVAAGFTRVNFLYEALLSSGIPGDLIPGASMAGFPADLER